jgi:hypothetical protein
MSQHVCGIADSRVNIPPRKSWICFNEIGLCGPVAKLPEDQLHRQPSSTNHRLPHHHFRIDFNSISSCHSRPMSVGFTSEIFEVRVLGDPLQGFAIERKTRRRRLQDLKRFWQSVPFDPRV